MTDRELLELAAKAAGHEVEFYLEPKNCLFVTVTTSPTTRLCEVKFDPLNDDGDALRLAVELDIHLTNSATDAWASTLLVTEVEPFNGDKLAATRRAIVRAAAAIPAPGAAPGAQT